MKCRRMGCEVRTEGLVTHYHRELGSLHAGRESQRYRDSGSSQQWHWYYASMLGSLSSLPMMGGGVFIYLRKYMICVQK